MYLIGRAWYCGLLGQSFMIDSLNYFSFQLVLHNSCGMYKSRLWDCAYKRSLTVNQNRATFWPTKFKTYYIAPKFYFRQTVEIAPNFLHWNVHICLLWLNPTGHSKHLKPPSACYRSRLYCSYSLVPASAGGPPLLHSPPYSLPSFFSCPWQRNWWRPVPVPMTGMHYNSLLWMCMLNTLTWPDLLIGKNSPWSGVRFPL